MILSIKNEYITALFSDFGAELKSLVFDGEEYIYPGDKAFWEGSSPVLFPICSGLKNDTYIYCGKEYIMPKHGFAKDLLFNVESRSENEIVFLLRDNEETFKLYPFHFEFRITYTLVGKALNVKYDIVNLNDYEMYCSFGAHEGYYCPEGIEDYDIILPKNTTLYHTKLTKDNLLGKEKVQIIENKDTLPLTYKYFDYDALIFENIDFNSLILKNRSNGKGVRVTFKDFPYLLLWTRPNAPYICVEPWCGITDKEWCDQNIQNKEGIETVRPNGTLTRTHSLEIL